MLIFFSFFPSIHLLKFFSKWMCLLLRCRWGATKTMRKYFFIHQSALPVCIKSLIYDRSEKSVLPALQLKNGWTHSSLGWTPLIHPVAALATMSESSLSLFRFNIKLNYTITTHTSTRSLYYGSPLFSVNFFTFAFLIFSDLDIQIFFYFSS